jgi:hypothetical protein
MEDQEEKEKRPKSSLKRQPPSGALQHRFRTKLVRIRMISVSTCVGLHGPAGKAMAFGEDIINFVNRFLSVAGRLARSER